MCVSSRGIYLASCVTALITAVGHAATGTIGLGEARGAVRSGSPKAATLERLLKPVHADFNDVRLEDVLTFLANFTDTDFDVTWTDEQDSGGLDKDARVTVKSNGLTALKLTERLLQGASGNESSAANTWQVSATGAFQIGPKFRLNKDRRLEVYDINDLVMLVPAFTNAPQLDLQAALQNSGAGGSTLFRETSQQQGAQGGFGVYVTPREERISSVAALLRELIETEQWTDNGGDGALMREHQGALLVSAPDYIHRQINGYKSGAR